MRIFDSLGKNWRQRALFVLTLILVILLASHPELRLLIPFIDALGLDLFLVLIGGQIWAYSKPILHGLYQRIVLPTARRGYSVFIFFFGCMGPYVDANISTRLQRGVSAA